MNADRSRPSAISGGMSARAVAGTPVKVTDGIIKFRLRDGRKMYLPALGPQAKPLRTGFLTRAQAVAYRDAVFLRYVKLVAAKERARSQSRWFKLLLMLAKLLTSVANRALTKVNEWTPR